MMKNLITILAIIFIGFESNAQELYLIQDKTVKQCNYSSQLIEFFDNADKNGNNRIEIDELQTFQNTVMSTYEYRSNDLALPPNEFNKKGGGDCEDFAAMTCCMLNHYKVVAYVVSFGVTVRGHAMCMAKINKKKVSNMTVYHLWGCPLEDGYFIPIDYDHVGKVSGAMDRRWGVSGIDFPNTIFFHDM